MAEQVTVGKIVHVQGGRGECQAAIVAHVHGHELVNVGLFTDQGIATPRTSVRQDERPVGERDVGTWHWPERAVPTASTTIPPEATRGARIGA